MSDSLPLPPELQHLIEKREKEERREKQRRNRQERRHKEGIEQMTEARDAKKPFCILHNELLPHWPVIDTPDWQYINHFPARALTFADRRYRLLRGGQDRWVTIESAYRGHTLTTRFHVAPNAEDSGFRLERLSSQETRP